jgi:hypothetical protein
MGRIEQTLLEGANRRRPNRPKTFARNPTIPEELTDVSIYDKGPGHPVGARPIPIPYARDATLAKLRGSTSRAAPILRAVEGSG